MKIYLVGGAVRDQLLGLPIKERDYVVVGATPDDMLKLQFRKVGKEFPVFLHPDTREEYALARMERKVKPGYKGFIFDTSPEVTLEDDLRRRDLTINAMALTPEGELIDPYHGQTDLEQKLLRHVSKHFMEDPVRILRVGRFLARFAHLGFRIAPETVLLMQRMVAQGEVNALVAERVWKELERALNEQNPEYFFFVLASCDALPILFPDLEPDGPGIAALEAACRLTTDPMIRFAALFYALPHPKEAIQTLANRYRLPNAYRELALLTALHAESALKAQTSSAEKLLRLFNALDIFRRHKRFQQFVTAMKAIALAQGVEFDADWLLACAKSATAFDVQTLIASGLEGTQLAEALKEKRTENIAAFCANQNR